MLLRAQKTLQKSDLLVRRSRSSLISRHRDMLHAHSSAVQQQHTPKTFFILSHTHAVFAACSENFAKVRFVGQT